MRQNLFSPQEESGEISIGGPAANRTRILSSGDSRSIHSTTGPYPSAAQRYVIL